MRKYYEPIIHILIWGIGFVLLLIFTSTTVDFKKESGPFWLPILFGMLMNQVVFYTTTIYLIPTFLRLKKIKTLVLFLLVGFVSITLFESFVDYTYLVNLFSTERESFSVYFMYNFVVGFFVLALALSYALLKYWIQNEKLKRILLEEKLSTEMAFLKSKINPHFLFNVLNSLYAKSLKSDAPELADGISKLAELMRYMVYETNEEKIALEKEIHHLKNYVKVYQLRIAENDDVLINIVAKGDIQTAKLSPMLLIPFVENAIKHGVNPKLKSVIDIFIEVENNTLYFKVTNTIHKNANGINDASSGFGLDNLKKRLSILYSGVYTLETTEENGLFISLLNLKLD